jgi:DNA-binding Lrp family transcriptional regulator
MATTIDATQLRNNCNEYARTAKSVGVLRSANGKISYKDIAKKVGLHSTKVSGLLKKAEQLGLARKMSNGFYKKNPGVLGYMPSQLRGKQTKSRTVDSVIAKLTGKKQAAVRPSLSSSRSIETNVERMASAYRLLFGTENVLRELIRRVLGQYPNWWKTRIPGGVQKTVTETMSKEPYHAATRADELEYTHLGQLMEIIISGKNWNNFLPYLKERDKNSFAATIRKAIPSRNATGHCIPLTLKDFKVVEVRFTDILAMLN